MVARISPAVTITMLITWMAETVSFSNQTASRLAITGMIFPKTDVLAGPILVIAAFQQKKAATDGPAPEYNRRSKSFVFQWIGAACLASIKNIG